MDLTQLDPNYLKRLADSILELSPTVPGLGLDWTLDEIIDALADESHLLNGDPRFLKARNKAVRQVLDELPRLATALSRLRVKSVREFPPVWIKSNKRIMRNLYKKGNQHFLPLYEILVDSRITPGEKGAPVLMLPDYALIERRTGLKRKYAYRYIREMCRCGILQRHHVDGERGPMIYSMGVWMPGRGKTPRPIFFLKETPKIKAALIEFDAQREQR